MKYNIFDGEQREGRIVKKLEDTATNYATAINQLVESKYFNDAVKAAKARDKAALKAAILSAGISEEMAEKMSALALDGSAVAVMCW